MYTFASEAQNELYQSILSDKNHWFEAKVVINGTTYGENKILSASAKYRMFNSEQPTVGGCLAGELELKMLAPSSSIPRMASVSPYVRAKDGERTSAWIPQGVFYIDTRETTQNDDGMDILTLHCYDAMLKAEMDFPGGGNISYPVKDYRMVQLIAYWMKLQDTTTKHVGIDARTRALMNGGSGIYDIDLPVGYSLREILSRIAAMYCGNWVMSYENKLRLVTLVELPIETSYLIDNAENAITFGGDRILV